MNAMRRFAFVFLLFSCVALCKAAFDACGPLAAKPPGDTVYIPSSSNRAITTTWGDLANFCNSLQKTTQEMVLYHWGDMPNCLRYGIQGKIDQGEMDYLCQSDTGMKSGGGMYLASTPDSTKGYGPCCTVATIPIGTPLYDPTLAQTYMGINPIDIAKKVFLGRVVPFIHNYDTPNKWYVTHNHLILQSLKSGPPADASDKVLQPIHFDTYLKMARSLYYDLNSDWFNGLPQTPIVNALRDGLGYLRSMIGLTHYYDGFSLLRAAKISPDNPWSVFDPLHFEAFNAALVKYHTAAFNSKSNGITSGGTFGAPGLNATGWAIKMLTEVIPRIYLDCSGETTLQVRETTIRAGGDETNNTFLATGKQVKTMQANPYLEVYAQPANDGNPDNYYVYYYYPDSYHWQKVAKMLPPDFVKELQAGGSNIKTAKVVSLLQLNLWASLFKYNVDVVPLPMVSLVGIHSYYDYNGRSTRFFGLASYLETLNTPPMSFLSDFDLVTEPNLYKKFIFQSSFQYTGLYQDMFNVMLAQAMRNGKKAQSYDYYNLPSWSGLQDSLSVFSSSCKHADLSDNRILEMIRKREWIPLLDAICGSSWR